MSTLRIEFISHFSTQHIHFSTAELLTEKWHLSVRATRFCQFLVHIFLGIFLKIFFALRQSPTSFSETSKYLPAEDLFYFFANSTTFNLKPSLCFILFAAIFKQTISTMIHGISFSHIATISVLSWMEMKSHDVKKGVCCGWWEISLVSHRYASAFTLASESV